MKHSLWGECSWWLSAVRLNASNEMAIRCIQLLGEFAYIVYKLWPKKLLWGSSVFWFISFCISSDDDFEYIVSTFENNIKQLLRKLIFVSACKTRSVIVDWRARVTYHEDTSFGLRNGHEWIFRVVTDNIFWKIFVWGIEFRRLVDEMEYTEWI